MLQIDGPITTVLENKKVIYFRFSQYFDVFNIVDIGFINLSEILTWEQRKVGELLVERNEQFPTTPEYPLMAFIANEGVAPKGERYDRSSLVKDTIIVLLGIVHKIALDTTI